MYSANQGPNELKRTINDQSTGNNINHRTKPLLSSRELANLPALRQTDLAQESEMRCHTCHSNGACVGYLACGLEARQSTASGSASLLHRGCWVRWKSSGRVPTMRLSGSGARGDPIVYKLLEYRYMQWSHSSLECKCTTRRVPIKPSLSRPCDECPPGPICYGVAR